MATGLGIDIGSEWVKAVQVECSGGKVTVTGALRIPRTAPAAPEEGAEGQAPAEQFAIPPNLGEELKRARLRRSGVLGLTGREILLRYLAVPPMPPAKLRMFIDMQVTDRLPGARKEEGPPAITYDFRILNIPTGLKGDLVVMAGLAKNEYLYGIFAAAKAAGVTPRRVVPSAFGLAQAYLRTQAIPAGETVALVDAGHELLEVAILHEEALYFARSGPGGGAKIDQSLAKMLGMRAERLKEFKHQRLKVLPEGVPARSPQEHQFQAALREFADGLSNGVRAAVTFCRTQAKLPKLDYQRIVLSGGGARLQGLPEYLEKKVQRPVQVLDLYSSLDLRKLDAQSAQCFETSPPDMTVALGLAILDADPSGFHLDLTPAPILRKREFWNKTVFAAAAGVVLVAGLAPPYYSAQESLRQAADKKQDLEAKAQDAEKLKKSFEKSVQDNQKLVLKREYYARQARLGAVYAELFTQMRGLVPEGMWLTHIGPKADASFDVTLFTESQRAFVVRGHHDTAVISEADALKTLDGIFKKVKEIPGVDGTPSLNPNFDDRDMPRPTGCRGFEFELKLVNPVRMVALPKAAPTAPAEAPRPRPVHPALQQYEQK